VTTSPPSVDRLSGFIDTLYTPLGTTGNTELPLISALYSSLLQTLVPSVCYSLHYPFPGNGFIRASLQLQITYEVFFAQPNSFLSIILNHLRLPTLSILCCNRCFFSLILAELNCRLTAHLELLKSSQFFLTEPFVITTLHGPKRQHSFRQLPLLCVYLSIFQKRVLLLLRAYSLPLECAYRSIP
jgi:hypothetical protein